MRRVTVRFGAAAHTVVEEAARAEGCSFAQYVREATLMRAAWDLAVGIGGEARDVEAITDAVRSLRAQLDVGVSAEAMDERVRVAPAIAKAVPAELNAALRRLDAEAPDLAAVVRDVYTIPNGAFLPES